MGQRGQTCRKGDRRSKLACDSFDVELQGEIVLVRHRGRVVRALTGHDAQAVRDAYDEPDKLHRVVARKVGRFKPGNEH